MLPFPASVVTFHTQGGSALCPAAAQFARVMQGTAGAGLPPGQKYPGAHSVALPALTDPAAHPYPGAALQGPLQDALPRPDVAPKTPAGQGRQEAVGEVTPGLGLKRPGAQVGAQVEGALAPVALL